MGLEALQRAVVWVDAGEGDGAAQVVAAGAAEEAGAAGDAGLERDAVARAERGDGGVGPEDDARGFVAEDVVAVNGEGADGAAFPEVDVGAAWGMVIFFPTRNEEKKVKEGQSKS